MLIAANVNWRHTRLFPLTTPPGTASNVAAFLTCLRAILSGDRDPALLADPALNYRAVAELTLLLETLSSSSRPGQA